MTDSISSFLCPITRKLMTDPVIDPDGNSYERSAIESWLKEYSTSPIVSIFLKINYFFHQIRRRYIHQQV
jgi:hypothetical protein